MKKNLMFALAAAACCTLTVPAYSQEAAPAPAPAAVAPAAASPHVQAMLDGVALMDKMANILEGVTDKATADAAAPEIAALGEQISALSAKTEALGEPSPEAEKELEAYAPQIIGTIMRLGMVAEKLAPDCFGSTALMEALQALDK